jgi:hypothetical protein
MDKTAGISTSVANAEMAMIDAMNAPTVMYGTNGAKNRGVKPKAITIALRAIALAGS